MSSARRRISQSRLTERGSGEYSIVKDLLAAKAWLCGHTEGLLGLGEELPGLGEALRVED